MWDKITWSELIRTMETIDCSCWTNYNKSWRNCCPSCWKYNSTTDDINPF